jgi:hypothetical protein
MKTDPVAALIRGRLTPSDAKKISKFSYKKDADFLKLVISNCLNRILAGPLIYTKQRFKEIKRRSETVLILKQEPRGQGLIQLNRLLMEDAFPLELSRRRLEQLPQVWAYEGVFRDLTTERIFTAQWLELEEAEILWQPHLFLGGGNTKEYPVELPYYFRMQLELRAFLPMDEWSNVYAGRKFKRDYCFQVRQCIKLKKGRLHELRMPVAKAPTA